tara:strand:- start:2107 stop:2316 length:210 start_codon:yes stop_codon:yes gene_type:complete
MRRYLKLTEFFLDRGPQTLQLGFLVRAESFMSETGALDTPHTRVIRAHPHKGVEQLQLLIGKLQILCAK